MPSASNGVQSSETKRNSLGVNYKNLQRNPDTTATCSYQLKPQDSRNLAALIGDICRTRALNRCCQPLGGANRRFQFHKRRQLFIRAHNEPFSVVAMCVHNPERSPFAIYRRDTAPTSTGFAEIVSDDFPLLHAADQLSISQFERLRFAFFNGKEFIYPLNVNLTKARLSPRRLKQK
jgi:hypothetical protein